MTPRLALGGRHPPRAGERGSTSIQMVMLMPALFAVMFLGLQGALYYYASNVAGNAAHEGASAASAYQNRENRGLGAAAASDALEQSHGSLQNWQVDDRQPSTRSPSPSPVSRCRCCPDSSCG